MCHFFPVLESGSIIALQIYDQRWLSLSSTYSSSSNCPGVTFNVDDWTRCPGEVLAIYRMKGPGPVLSGDTVGIYYPNGKTWFSMSSGRGHKDSCPGVPNINTGFNRDSLWVKCWGDVFTVYAKGKSDGDQITRGNRLAFYFPADPSHVSFNTGDTTLSQCMRRLSDNNSKPSACAFEACTEDIVRVAIR